MADQESKSTSDEDPVQYLLNLMRQRILASLQFVPLTVKYNNSANPNFRELVQHGLEAQNLEPITEEDYHKAYQILTSTQKNVDINSYVVEETKTANIVDGDEPSNNAIVDKVMWVIAKFQKFAIGDAVADDDNAIDLEKSSTFVPNAWNITELYADSFDRHYADFFQSASSGSLQFETSIQFYDFLTIARLPLLKIDLAQQQLNTNQRKRPNEAKCYLSKSGKSLYVPTFILQHLVTLMQELRHMYLQECTRYSDNTDYNWLLKKTKQYLDRKSFEQTMQILTNKPMASTSTIPPFEISTVESILTRPNLNILEQWMCLKSLSFWKMWYQQYLDGAAVVKEMDTKSVYNYYRVEIAPMANANSVVPLSKQQQTLTQDLPPDMPELLLDNKCGNADAVLAYLADRYPLFFAYFLRYFCCSDIDVDVGEVNLAPPPSPSDMLVSPTANEESAPIPENPSQLPVYVKSGTIKPATYNSVTLGGDMPALTEGYTWRCYYPALAC